jgi:nucleotide-binding universal stress UspA family protein
VSGTIVVGVDGSAASHEALRWAAQEARLRGARLVAVHAWSSVPVAPIGDPGMIPMLAVDYPGQLEAEQEGARADLDGAVVEVLGAAPESEIEKRLVEDDAGEALVEESTSADLLVVGSHGRSGLKAAVLGSVSRHVVERAVCPVVVVKASS